MTPAVLALLLLAAPAGAEKLFRKGEILTFEGRLTDEAGAPLAGASVNLELTRTHFSVLRMKTVTEGPVQVPTTTDTEGRYRITWGWDPYYDGFVLAVGLPVRKEGQEGFEILQRWDVTARVEEGSATVSTSLVLEEAGTFRWLKRYLENRASSEELKVLAERGQPERIDYEERGGRVEMAWWYFEAGKCYRFEDGRLDQVIPFEPVVPP